MFNIGDDGRNNVIDVSRGVFVIWMTIAHSLTIAGVSHDSILQYLRPSGWATTCFVMLTGFSCAFLANKKNHDYLYLKDKFFTKSFKLIIIAVSSNVIFQLVRVSCNGRCSIDKIYDIIALKNEWTISSIILSTAIVLFFVPFLSGLYRKYRPVKIFLLLNFFLIVIFLIYRLDMKNNFLFAEFFYGEYFYFPIFLYAIYSIWFFSLICLVLSSDNPNGVFWSFLLLALVALLFVFFDWFPPQVDSFIRIVAEIMLSLATVSISLSFLPVFIVEFISGIGSYALLFFILHRVLLFFLDYCFCFIHAADFRGILYILVNLFLFCLILYFRKNYLYFNIFLKKLWL